MADGPSSLHTSKLTAHLLTNAEVIRLFLPIEIAVDGPPWAAPPPSICNQRSADRSGGSRKSVGVKVSAGKLSRVLAAAVMPVRVGHRGLTR
jgi:hypothetical protein